MASATSHERDAREIAAALEAAFTRIERERMAGLPLLHAGLRVQVVDPAPWQDGWLLALVTPWFLNLVLVPRVRDAWAVACGERVARRFGAGEFSFLGNAEPEVGCFLGCSLVSPMGSFPDQAHAVATARAALRMLHVEQPAAALAGGGAAAAAPCASEAAPSRRTLLFAVRR